MLHGRRPGVDAEKIMARVRNVLDPLGEGEPNPEKWALFRNTSQQMEQFGIDRHNPIVSVVDHIGNYWRNWILALLNIGPYRPSKISRLLEAIDPTHPISQRMLTLNLRMLERDGLIWRDVKCTKHNHVEYQLTPLGEDLAKQIMAVIEWSGRHASEISDARRKFDLENE